MTIQILDRSTGDATSTVDESGVMPFLLQLHTDMFLGLPGMLFLGLMGLIFVIAIVSGVVLYAPFMKKLDFGTLRTARSRRVKWLDYHNLLGLEIGRANVRTPVTNEHLVCRLLHEKTKTRQTHID